jgi:CIC family chloride channel protein
LLSLTLASQQATILGLTDKDALVLKSDASIQQAIEAAANFIGETIPVIDKETDAFIGAINEGDIFKLYLKLQGQTIDLEKS